jgi:hypothetical protein
MREGRMILDGQTEGSSSYNGETEGSTENERQKDHTVKK